MITNIFEKGNFEKCPFHNSKFCAVLGVDIFCGGERVWNVKWKFKYSKVWYLKSQNLEFKKIIKFISENLMDKAILNLKRLKSEENIWKQNKGGKTFLIKLYQKMVISPRLQISYPSFICVDLCLCRTMGLTPGVFKTWEAGKIFPWHQMISVTPWWCHDGCWHNILVSPSYIHDNII